MALNRVKSATTTRKETEKVAQVITANHKLSNNSVEGSGGSLGSPLSPLHSVPHSRQPSTGAPTTAGTLMQQRRYVTYRRRLTDTCKQLIYAVSCR